MMTNILPRLTWSQVASFLAAQPTGSQVQLHIAQIEHPRDAGMHLSIGYPLGQRSEYRVDLLGGARLAVSDFGHCYLARIEQPTTATSLETSLRETPGASVVGMTALGALLGLLLGQSKDAALAGAAIGGIAGLAGVG